MSGGRQLQIDNTNKDNICRYDLCILQNETMETCKINKKILRIVKKDCRNKRKKYREKGLLKRKMLSIIIYVGLAFFARMFIGQYDK